MKVFEKLLFIITDPIIRPARAVGLFDPKRVGATAIEYALIAAGISIVILAILQGFGPQITKWLGG